MTAPLQSIAPAAGASTSAAPAEVFVARQPIFDARDTLVGYELLYRGSATATRAEGLDAEGMSVDVIVTTFLGIGVQEITGEVPAFINFTGAQLVDELWRLFDPKTIVVELLETTSCDAEMLAAARELSKAGYRLALDDFEWNEHTEPLLEFAEIVKVDVLGRDPAEVAALAERLKPRKVTLLAERVETEAVREACRAAGYTLFQGYFFAKPETVARREPSVGQLTILRLLNLLRDPNVADGALDQAFGTDVTLAYKLLRMVNSASTGARGIESIGHAVRILGRNALHRWLALLFVSSLSAEGGARAELAQAAMVRARLCELLVEATRSAGSVRRDPGSAFMVGLFSLIDAMMRMPMADVLARVDLSAEVRAALAERSGPYAPPLFLAESYEQGNWDSVRFLSKELGVDGKELAKMYVTSLRWAREQLGSKGAGARAA